MAKFNSEQLDDLLYQLKDWWDVAKEKINSTKFYLGGGESIDGQGGEVFTVKNRTELLNALNKGDKRIIYVEGVIDMTDTGNGSLIPSTYSGSTSELDKMIEKYTADSVLPCKNRAILIRPPPDGRGRFL